jgi:hypothetical protein
MDTVIAAYISGPEHNFADNDNFVLHTPTSFATPQLRDLYQQIRDGFFRHQDAALLPTLLSERISPVRRNELLFCLRFVHFHALNSVLTALEDHDLMPVRPPQDTFRAASAKPIALRQMFEALRASELEHPDHPEFAEVMSTICNQQSAQLAIINEYNGLLSSIGRAWQTVISDFPERYVIQLDKLLYSDWYAACFISDPDHAAMWGHYGDGHKGVCLKFRTHINASGMPSITLLETDEWAGRQNIANPKAVAHQLYKVNYQERFVEIDFFLSLSWSIGTRIQQEI